jgi:hypothetical protein
MAIPASSPAGTALRVVDITSQFDRFVMSTTDMPDAQRIRAFEKQIGPIANGFYSRERRPDGYDFRILVQLKTYPQRRTGVLAVSRRFNGLFAPARQRFEAVFGPPLPHRQRFSWTAWENSTAASVSFMASRTCCSARTLLLRSTPGKIWTHSSITSCSTFIAKSRSANA